MASCTGAGACANFTCVDLFHNAQGPNGNCLNSGDTAWMLTSTAIVLLMTIPGLAMFYGGMVQPKNYLSTVMQVFTICCLITCIWMIFGYSLAFRPGTPVIGNASRFWLLGMETWSVHPLAPTIPESVFATFQMTFAIITAALIVGGFAERMKFSSLIVFISAWHLITYCPIAHSVWALDGVLRKRGVLDYAGGGVVHLNSGVSALMCALALGKRRGHGSSRFEPHNVSISLIGASLLWVGWFGFNAGSASAANAFAGMAMVTTQVATGAAALSWMFTAWFLKGKPTLMSVISGAVAGLVAITPAAGFVDPNGAIIMGFVVGIVCCQSVRLKHYFGFDDALDAFGVHGVGGAMGSFLTGLFAQPKNNQMYPPGACPYGSWVYNSTLGADQCSDPNGGLVSGAFYDHTLSPKRHGKQIGLQLLGIVVEAGWAAFTSFILLKIIDKLMGLRVEDRHELEGLDSSVHGEFVYYASEDLKPVMEEGETACADSARNASASALKGVATVGGPSELMPMSAAHSPV